MASNSLARMVWRVSLPIIMVEATETLDHLIDTLFLARVGVTELGALAVADAMMLLFLILPLALVDGMQILTARRVGQRRPAAVGTVFNQSLLIALGLSLLSLLALKLFSPLVANWVVESNEVGNAVDGYLQLDAYSIPLAAVTFAFSNLLTSLGKTRALIPATLIVVVTDIVLNYLFIFGKFGFPEMGMRGAAVGSIGAELAAAVFLTVYVARTFDCKKYGFFRFRAFDPHITRQLRNLSLPMMAQGGVEEVRWFAFFLLVERMGAESLAVANIVFTCYLVLCIPSEGFAEAACSLVSRYLGRDRGDRTSEVLRHSSAGALAIIAPVLALTLLAPQWLVAAFAPGAELLPHCNASLRILAVGMLIAIPASMWFTAVEATGDTLAALGIDVVLTLVMLAATYGAVILLAWPIELVWLVAPLSWLVELVSSYFWVKSGFWKRLEV